MNIIKISIITISILCANIVHGALFLINETWSNGNRTLQDLPNDSMAWFSSGAASNLTATTGSMTHAGTGSHSIAYFTDQGSPVTLQNNGDFLSVSFSITFDGTITGSNFFRFGLWNSGGSRISADGQAASNAVYEDYTGYGFFGRANGESSSLRKRQIDDPSLLASFGTYDNLQFSSAFDAIVGNTPYNAELIVTRVGDNLSLDFSMNDYSLTVTDTSPLSYSFDSLGFLVGTGMGDGYTLSQVTVAIPEPRTAAAVFGLFSLLGVLALRRFQSSRVAQ